MSITRWTLAGSVCALLACGPDSSEPEPTPLVNPGDGTFVDAGSTFGGPGGGAVGGLLGGSGGFGGFAAGGFPAGLSPVRLMETRTAPQPPRPISGGTLTVSPDGVLAVAADPDRDTVYVIRTDSLNVRKIDLPAGSEPGRVVLDGAGAAHVVLRGSGKLLRVDLASATAGAEVKLCSQPRGVAYDAGRGALVAACMDGDVVTLSAQDYTELSRRFVAYDLRDVVIGSGGRVFVSRYRSAELLRLDAAGAVQATSQPPQGKSTRFGFVGPGLSPNDSQDPRSPPPTSEPLPLTFSPTLAWRALGSSDGSVWMLHQEAQNEEVSVSTGGYGNSCAPIAQTAVTLFNAEGQPARAVPVAMVGVSVDVALSPAGNWLAVASPGGYLMGKATLQLYETSSMGFELPMDSCPGPSLFEGDSSQVIAVAFDGNGLLYTYSREPAELQILEPGPSGSGVVTRLATVTLDRRSVRDTGHELFHTDVGSGLSCASCHGEALDDGHVWAFQQIGPRRTQNMRGGLLETAPFHWDGDMGDFKRLVDDVMTGRMGGFPVSDEHALALARWIDAQPALLLPAGDPAAVARGRALFDSSATQCSTCHNGGALTDNRAADVGTGGKFQVPSLRGLGLRPPYMHNGCAKTIEARFVDAACGGGDRHGNTSQLDAAQIADLSAYLRTL